MLAKNTILPLRSNIRRFNEKLSNILKLMNNIFQNKFQNLISIFQIEKFKINNPTKTRIFSHCQNIKRKSFSVAKK